MEMRTQFNPDSILFIYRKVLPRLRELGIGQDVLDTILIENPRRFFEGS